jgi:hypothetical protein
MRTVNSIGTDSRPSTGKPKSQMNNLNLITVLALLSWPIVALWLYRTQPIGRAMLWTILGGYLLLPVGAFLKIPMIPQFDKSSIPTFAALLGCTVVGKRPIRFSNGFGLAELLMLMLLVYPFITCELNGDPLSMGNAVLPALGSYEAGSVLIGQLVTLIPFVLGRRFLCNRADTKEILRVLVIANLGYSLLSLFEIRFSPQLHAWIYGYFPMEGDWFGEQQRGGGFRPAVFLGHGLLVAFFVSTGVVAAAALWRTKTQVFDTFRLPSGMVIAYLGVLLVLCKTASALIYGVLLVFVVCLTRPRMQVGVAVALTSLALLYPVLRSADIVPTNATIELATSWFGSDRAASLGARLANEDALLERASQRFFFGWGTFGRGFVYDESGNLVYAPDGYWVIVMGAFGFLGFLALFGLLSLPVFVAARAVKFAETFADKLFLSALALIVAVNIFDLLPNSSIRPWTWLLAGALLGRSEWLLEQARFSRRSELGVYSGGQERLKVRATLRNS